LGVAARHTQDLSGHPQDWQPPLCFFIYFFVDLIFHYFIN